MVLFNIIDIYSAIMFNWQSVACLAQWVEHVNIASLYFKLCVVSTNPYATFIIVTIEKTIVFIFIKFSPFAISFLDFNQFDLFGDNSILSSDP